MNKTPILFYDDEGWFAKPYLEELEKNFNVHFCEDITNGDTIIVTRIERFWRHFPVESSRNRAVNTGENM